MIFVLENLDGWSRLVESAAEKTASLRLLLVKELEVPDGLPDSVAVEIVESSAALLSMDWGQEENLYLVTSLPLANSPEVRPHIDVALDHVAVHWGTPEFIKDKSFSYETFRFSPATKLTGWHAFTKGKKSPKDSFFKLWSDRIQIFYRMILMRMNFMRMSKI